MCLSHQTIQCVLTHFSIECTIGHRNGTASTQFIPELCTKYYILYTCTYIACFKCSFYFDLNVYLYNYYLHNSVDILFHWHS